MRTTHRHQSAHTSAHTPASQPEGMCLFTETWDLLLLIIIFSKTCRLLCFHVLLSVHVLESSAQANLCISIVQLQSPQVHLVSSE